MTNAAQLRRKSTLVRPSSKAHSEGEIKDARHRSISSAAKAKPHKEAPRETSFTLLEQVQRSTIIRVLKATGGNKLHAARRLGIGRQTLYNKIEAFGIEA